MFLQEHLVGHTTAVVCDNTTVVATLTRREAVSLSLCFLARQLHLIELINRFSLRWNIKAFSGVARVK